QFNEEVVDTMKSFGIQPKRTSFRSPWQNGVADAVVGEAALPNWELRGEAMGEAALNEAHRSFECDGLWSEDKVDVVGHDDESMQLVVALAAIVLEGFNEEFGVDGKLEETATVVGCGGDEECAVAGCAGRDRHTAIVRRVSQGLKPLSFACVCGTAEAVPLCK